MTCFGGAPLSSRSLAIRRFSSIRALRGPEEDVDVDAASASSASKAVSTSVVDMVVGVSMLRCYLESASC